MLKSRKGKTGAQHQSGAEQQEIAQIVPRRDEAHGKRQQRRPEQRRGGDETDLHGTEADRGEIGGQ